MEEVKETGHWMNGKKVGTEPGWSFEEYQPEWKVSLSDDLQIRVEEAPNWFWRFTQWIVLGFRWERVNKPEGSGDDERD